MQRRCAKSRELQERLVQAPTATIHWMTVDIMSSDQSSATCMCRDARRALLWRRPSCLLSQTLTQRTGTKRMASLSILTRCLPD